MDKLDKVREYVENMSPVFRAAMLKTYDEMLQDKGYDSAMRMAQEDLLDILDAPDDSEDYNSHPPLT